MATTITEAELAIILRAKNQTDKAFKELDTQIKLTERQMSGLHAEALRMNAQFTTSTARAGQFAGAIGNVSTTLARSAGALGLPVEALRALDDVSDAAALGLQNVSKSAIGFNAASVGAAGAGFALGTVIGKLILQIPGVEKAADNAAKALFRLFGAETEARGFDAATRAKLEAGAIQAKTQALTIETTQWRKVIEQHLAAGKSVDAVRAHYKELGKEIPPSIKGWLDGLDRTKKSSDQAAEATKQMVAKNIAAIKQQEIAHKQYEAALVDVTLTQIEYQKVIGDEEAARKASFLGEVLLKQIKEQKAAYESMVDAQIDDSQRLEDHRAAVAEAETERWNDMADQLSSIAGTLGEADGLFDVLGVSADNTLRKMAQGFADVADSAGNFARAMATGNIFDQIGAGIGLLTTTITSVKNIFRDEEEDVNDLRDVFIAAAGGVTELDRKAQAAGLTVKDLLDADTVAEYEAAIRQLTGAFDTQAEAQRLTNEAIERYGFSIEELGPKFAQQKLDEQFQTLFQDYQLLNAAGVDHNAILARMGPSLNEYVNSAIKAGGTIPEAMRPVVEEMIKNKQLVDENGVAYESAEAAGINFAQTLEEGISKLIDKITLLVNAMLGIPNIERTVTVNTQETGGNGGAREHGFQHGGAVTQWGVPAMLHGTQSNPEFVLQKSHLQEIAKIMSANGGSQPAGGGVVQVFIGGEQLDHVIMKRLKGGHIRVPPDAVSKAGF